MTQLAQRIPASAKAPTTPLLRQRWFRVTIFSLFLAFALLWMAPIIWTVATSLRTQEAIQRDLVSFIPVPFTLDHWQRILGASQLPRWFLNSIFVSTSTTVLNLFINSLAAYAFVRLPFSGKRILYPLVLIGLMIPSEATFIPVYLFFADLKLHNTFIALIMPGLASSFGVFLMVQFFKGIPGELMDAAFVDGAGHWTVYSRIVLPLSRPVLTTLAVFTFLGSWNSYLWPLVSATSPEVMTLTVGLNNLSTSVSGVINYGWETASAAAAALPAILFFLVFQRQIISGIQVSSGLKG
jgi:multiple sugar transport system permease protein